MLYTRIASLLLLVAWTAAQAQETPKIPTLDVDQLRELRKLERLNNKESIDKFEALLKQLDKKYRYKTVQFQGIYYSKVTYSNKKDEWDPMFLLGEDRQDRDAPRVIVTLTKEEKAKLDKMFKDGIKDFKFTVVGKTQDIKAELHLYEAKIASSERLKK